jgi:hypothetical protein
VGVFFLPGTEKPLPIFFGAGWRSEDDASDPLSKPRMLARIEDVASILQHTWDPIPENIAAGQSSLVKWMNEPTNADQRHFFLFAKRFVELISLVPARDPSATPTQSQAGFRNFTFFVRPPRAEPSMPLDVALTLSLNSGQKVVLRWKTQSNRGNPDVICASPIFIDHDSFVLVTSYLKTSSRGAALNRISDFLDYHHVAAASVFGPVYHTVLRENSAALRRYLQRSLVSRAVLTRCSRVLRKTPNDGFTYYWRKPGDDKSGSGRPAAELKAHILEDLATRPENIFNLVIGLQESLYGCLRAEANQLSKPLKALGFAGLLTLPEELPLTPVLRMIEEGRRAYGLTGRDHVVHQFQVFLLGSLALQSVEDKYQQYVWTDLFPNGSDEKLADKDRKAVTRHLLKLAWFLTSNYHDVGYPVQLIEDSVNDLQRKVGQILRLSQRFLPITPRFGIEPLLYDDPRTYCVVQDLAKELARCFDAPRNDHEAWSYLLRNYVFNDKHHAGISAIILERTLSDVFDSPTTEQNGGMCRRFLLRHVLLPIMLHHAYKWSPVVRHYLLLASKEDPETLRHAERNDEKMLGGEAAIRVKKTAIERQLAGLFRQEQGGQAPHKWIPDFTLSASRLPMAGLLAFCDCLQEVGRPSGTSEPTKPEATDDDVSECRSEKHACEWCYSLQFRYEEDNHETDKDYGDLVRDIGSVADVFDLTDLRETICIQTEALTRDGKPFKRSQQVFSPNGKNHCPCHE